jgi:hypothetical protein
MNWAHRGCTSTSSLLGLGCRGVQANGPPRSSGAVVPSLPESPSRGRDKGTRCEAMVRSRLVASSGSITLVSKGQTVNGRKVGNIMTVMLLGMKSKVARRGIRWSVKSQNTFPSCLGA